MERGLLHHTTNSVERSQSSNLVAGTEIETMEKHCLLACFHSILVRVFIAVIKHHEQKQPEKERLHFGLQLSGPTLILRGVRRA